MEWLCIFGPLGSGGVLFLFSDGEAFAQTELVVVCFFPPGFTAPAQGVDASHAYLCTDSSYAQVAPILGPLKELLTFTHAWNTF